MGPAPLPVLAWLPVIAAHTGTNTIPSIAPLVTALCREAPALHWRQTYSVREAGQEFLESYGYTELIGPTAPCRSDQLACGFLLLGPRTVYPRHRHEAEEIYIVLTGDAEWLQGDAVWRRHPPGSVVHHRSEEMHAMRTGEEPLLALYLWRSADLNQKARLDPTGSTKKGTV
jgi:hypothetical protein